MSVSGTSGITRTRVLTFTGIFLILIIIFSIAYIKYGQTAVEVLGIITSTAFSLTLVALYYVQAVTQDRQSKLMEYQNKLEQANHKPDFEIHNVSVEDGDLQVEIENVGNGIGVNPKWVINSVDIDGTKTDVSGKCESVFRATGLNDPDPLGVIRPGEVLEIRIPAIFPLVEDGEVSDLLPFEDWKNKYRSEGVEQIAVQSEFRVEDAAGESHYISRRRTRAIHPQEENERLENLI